MQKNYSDRKAAVFSFRGRLVLSGFSFSPTSRLYFALNDILSSLQPLQVHNIASVSTELKGRGIQTRIWNYFTLSIMHTKISISATVKIHDVGLKVAVSVERNGLS